MFMVIFLSSSATMLMENHGQRLLNLEWWLMSFIVSFLHLHILLNFFFTVAFVKGKTYQ